MNVRLARRLAFEVRRDAAIALPNGRMMYDALFSRVGLQAYGNSVEYRPPEEVFAPRSLASLALLPGVLLHPDVNYGTSFGPGSYPVRGCTGDKVVPHTDGIHTAGKLMVWDAEWNALISSRDVAQLSLGYGIRPDEAPGTAPAGTPGIETLGDRYGIVHRDILGDHAAGVPLGNAGTAEVKLDAIGDIVTRRALADIAAARMDARPLYFDLGSWPTRRDEQPVAEPEPAPEPEPQQDQPMDPVQAFLSSLGDPAALDMAKLIAAILASPEIVAAINTAAAPAPEAPPPAAAPPASEPVPDAGTPEGEKPDPAPVMDAAKIEAEVRRRVDAAMAAEHDRADALEIARAVFGRDYKPRLDDGPVKTADQIKREILAKRDPEAIERVDAESGDGRSIALRVEFARVRKIIDADLREGGERLREEISRSRNNVPRNDGNEPPAEFVEAAKRIARK